MAGQQEAQTEWLESLPVDTNSYLFEDGTLLFFKSGPHQALYGWGKDRTKLVCELPKNEMLECAGSAGNSLFFYSKTSNKCIFYRATVDEQGRTIQFRMTYERQISDETLWFACQQPFYQFKPLKENGLLDVFDFTLRDHVTRYSTDMVICEEFYSFIVHREHLYLLVEKPKLLVRRITNGPRAIVLVTLPDPKSAGVFAQENSKCVFILTIYRTILVIEGEVVRTINMQINNPQWNDSSSSRMLSGLYKGNLLANIKNQGGLRNLERWKVQLTNEFIDETPNQDAAQSDFPMLAGLDQQLSSLLPREEENETVKPNHNFTSKFLTDFKLNRHLGQGTFGIVFEAEHFTDKKKYAVKRVHIPPEEDKLSKALGEVYLMADLEHPGIVRYYNSWKDQPPTGWQMMKDKELPKADPNKEYKALKYFDHGVFIYIQMQLCKESLEDWLASNMEIRDAATMKGWLEKLFEAVAYIHARGIFHRDLKPGNILFDGNGQPKICDVGIATAFERNEEGEKTKTRTEDSGTPLYKAPEQRYWIYKSKVDIFSLGLIFAEMSVPMTGNEREKIFDNYRKGQPNDILKDAPVTAEFINWLTTFEADDRPTCKQVLDSHFFAV